MDVKAALKSLWKDTCTIYESEEYTAANKSTQHREVMTVKDEPCKLSFKNLQPTNQTDSAALLIQSVKLFIDKNINVKAGSKIVVKRNDTVFEFAQSGAAGIFTNHQEIPLVPYEEYA